MKKGIYNKYLNERIGPDVPIGVFKVKNRVAVLTPSKLDNLDEFPGFKKFMDDIENMNEQQDASKPKYHLTDEQKIKKRLHLS